MSDKFLNKLELVELTGCVFKAKQIAVLKSQGVPFRINVSGRPVVTWEAVNGRKDTVKITTWAPPV